MRSRTKKLLVALAVSALAMVGFPRSALALDDLAVSSPTASPGKTVTISGTCDPPVLTFLLTTVDISADTVPPETDSATVGPGGTFSFDFEVDATATAGTVTFTVTCNSAFTISIPPAAPIVIPGVPEVDTVACK